MLFCHSVSAKARSPESRQTVTLALMEAMEDDGPDSKDDHNHNYCPSGGGKVRAYASSQPSEAAAGVKQSVRLPASAQEPVARQGNVWSGTGLKSMDSDSSSESSEVSELEGSAPPGSSGEGKFTLDSTSKFRKLVCFSSWKRTECEADMSRSTRPVTYPSWRRLRLTVLSGLAVIAASCFEHSLPFRPVLNAMAVDDYRKNHWPNLEKAIVRLLIQNPTDHISVSYAQIYR